MVCNTRSGIEWGWFRTKGNRQALQQNNVRMNIIWGTWQGASDRRWQIEDIWGLCHTLPLPPQLRPQSPPGFPRVRSSDRASYQTLAMWSFARFCHYFSLFWRTVKVNCRRKRPKRKTLRICKIYPLSYFLFSCEDHLLEEGKLSSKSLCKYKITSEVCCDLLSCQSKETTAVCSFRGWFTEGPNFSYKLLPYREPIFSLIMLNPES